MEGPNYFRTAMEFFARAKVIPGSSDFRKSLQLGMSAPKFVLPNGGMILDTGLKCIPDQVRLPYPCVVIEYACREEYLKGMAQEAAGRHIADPVLKMLTTGKWYRDKIAVIATQEDSGPISITVLHHVPDENSWIGTPYVGKVPSDKDSLAAILESNTLPMEAPNETKLSQEWYERMASGIMKGPIRAVCELCEALSFSNITEVEIPAKKMTFTEQRKKALPYDSYRMLVVNKTEAVVSAARSETGVCGERRLAREHTRRGHDRTYKSGKKIWINPMVVNAGVGGKIVKDYQLK